METWKKALATFIVYYIFLYVGAAIFMYIEEKGLRDETDDIAANTQLLKTVFQTEHNLTLNGSQLNKIIKLSYQIRSKVIEIKTRSWKKQISFDTWFRWRVFAHVTITTVGFGNVVPETDGGKIFVIFYALIGLPINVFMITLIGSMMSTGLTRLVRLTGERLFKMTEVKRIHDKTCLLIAAIFLLWWTGGATIAKHKMNWSWVDGFYQAFIQQTTIGYGDMRLIFDSKVSMEFFSWYVCIGLAFAAAFFNSITEAMQKEAEMLEDNDKEEVEPQVEMKNRVAPETPIAQFTA